jgi:N-acetylneuraminic acid mutarotase
MKKTLYFRLFPCFSLLMIGLSVLMLPDCGSKTQPSSNGETGSILVRWGTDSSQAECIMGSLANGFDCGAYGIETVDARVYDENGDFLVPGGPWSCEDHEGIIGGVGPGNERTVVLMARNMAGDILFRDEMTGVSVAAGKTTFPGDFSLDPVAPYLSNWVLTASMPLARSGHTATLLNDSKVLAAGGCYCEPGIGAVYYHQCTLYDPVTHVWSNTAGLQIARANHRAVLLSDGRVLVCGGASEIEGVYGILSSCEIYDPVSGTWSPATDMRKPRTGHTATLLQNGRVLVTGGYNDDDGYLSECEVYDPETDLWIYGGWLNQPRWTHEAAGLDDGSVLIIGGYFEDEEEEWEILTSCEIYDSDSGTCTLLEHELNAGRSGPVVTTLADGRVAVFGGYAGSGYFNQSCEIFDPESRSWTLHGDTIRNRTGFSVTLLPNGEVLIAGGDEEVYFQSFCELFNPQTGVYTYTDGMLQRRAGHTDTLLHDATVLVTGGYLADGTSVSTCEFYQFEYPADTAHPIVVRAEPAGGAAGMPLSTDITLSIRDPLPENGSFHGVDRGSIAVTVDGAAAISGGLFQEGFEGLIVPDDIGGFHIAIDPEYYFESGQTVTVTVDATDRAPVPNALVQEQYSFTCTDSSWSLTGAMNQGRSNHTMTVLPDGKVLAAGGIYSGLAPVSSSEIYDPDTGTWIPAGSMNLERYNHRATRLQNGRVLVTGGHMGEWQTESCELFDPEIGTWTWTGGMEVFRSGHTATLLADGKVLVAGGFSGEGYLDSCEIYDPATLEWTATGSLNQARSSHEAALLSDGKVLVVGGSYEEDSDIHVLSSCEVFDPATGTWDFLESELITGRSGPNLEVLGDGRLFVMGGFVGSGTFASSCELYDPGDAEPVWEAVESMIVDRNGGCSVVLDSGLVMIVGGSWYDGYDIVPTSSCELYDPDTDTWNETSDLIVAREGHGAILLENGTVLVTGGFDSPASLSSCELYEP